jgi:hypothetical protein
LIVSRAAFLAGKMLAKIDSDAFAGKQQGLLFVRRRLKTVFAESESIKSTASKAKLQTKFWFRENWSEKCPLPSRLRHALVLDWYYAE